MKTFTDDELREYNAKQFAEADVQNLRDMRALQAQAQVIVNALRAMEERFDVVREMADRLEALEAAVFRAVPRAQADGWITNGYPADSATLELIESEAGPIRIGEPKATKQRTAEDLKNSGLIGIYRA